MKKFYYADASLNAVSFLKLKINSLTLAILFAFFFLASMVQAQYVTSYTAVRTTATYSVMTGGTQLCSAATCADAVYTVALPWSFTYNGVSYSTVYISQNGFISFGSAAVGTNYTPISTAGTSGIISVWGYNSNVTVAAHVVRYKNNGTSFSIEWVKAGTGSNLAGTHLDTQITLYQTTNVIEFTYRAPGSYPVNGSLNGQVGLRGALNTEFKNLTTIIAAVTYGGANTATANFSSGNYTSVNNTKITWTPPAFCTPPTTQATIGSFSGLTTSAVTVNWANGNGAARVVVAHQTSAVSATPLNGTDYSATANAAFGSGANLGTNNYVVYQGTGTSVNVTGLTGGQTYHFSVFDYATSPSICYLSPGSSSSQAIPTCFPPTTSSSGMSFSNVLTTSNDVNWVRGNGDGGVVVVARLTSTAAVAPISGTAYTTTTFGSGSGNQLTGAGNYVVYVGTGTSVNVSNLLPSTNYTYSVYEYMLAGTCFGSSSTASQTTASCSPSTDASAPIFSNVLGASLTLSFTRGSGSNVMVVARATATSNVAPIYNTTYTANTVFGSGSTTGTGNFVVFNGTGNTVNITGLTQFTSYTFLVYEYNATPNCYSISPLSTSTTTLNTTATGLALSCAYTGTSQALTLATIVGASGAVNVALGASIDDGNYPNQNIASMTGGSGFLFSYLGTDYSSFGINANGFIWFGSGQPASAYASFGGTPVGSASANLGGSGTINGIIAAAGADLISHYHITAAPATSQINVVVTGTAPNRIVTIEWTGFQAKSLGNNSSCWSLIGSPDDSRLDFQIKLNEKGGTNSNRIEMIYRDQNPFCVFDSYNFQVGLRGASSADFATRANTGSMTSSSTTIGGSATTVITLSSSTFISGNVGVRYQPNLSTPTVTGSLANSCPAVSTTLTSSSATNNQWFLNGSVIPGPGSNTQTLVATQSGSYAVTVNGSGCYSQSAASVVTISPCAVNITASAGTGGTISPTGVVAVPYGTNQLFTVTPACGYSITNVLVDGVSQGALATYTFNNVTVVHSISASFTLNPEICNGLDDDCDGTIDEGFDTDNDGFTACGGDCNDANAAINPAATEICNGINDDCDAFIDEGFDLDGDGYVSCTGDCNDNNAAIHPGATEICNSIDEDCDSLIDEGFDLDGDSYTTCAGDCNDSDASINPGATESCLNSIDDNCNSQINEGCTPNFYGDTPGTAPSVIYSSNAAYPNCYPINGDLTNAGNSPESIFNGPDTWYSFVAQSNGITITMTSATMNNAIALYSKSGAIYNLIDSENINPAGVGGFERLTNATLTPGITYYISAGAASGNTGGAFSLCIQHLMPSGCAYTIPTGGFALCENFKAIYRGAVGNGVTYNFNFAGVGGGATGFTSWNGTNGLIPLSGAALALQYGGVYDVRVDVVYSIQNGAGVYENMIIAGNAGSVNCSNVTIAAQPILEVKLAQRCPATLLRSNYLIGTAVAGSPNACAAINYTYEFTQVTSCANSAPISAFPLTFTTTGNTPYLQLGNLPNLTNQGAWRVRIRPNFNYGIGSYGPSHSIIVNNTSASVMLPESELNDDLDRRAISNIATALYPNPNSGEMVNVNLTGLTSDQLFIKVTDGMGRNILNKTISVDGSLNTVLVFDSPLSAGFYLIEFNSGESKMIERMIVE